MPIPLISPIVSATSTGTTRLELMRRVADTVGFRVSTVTTAEAAAGDTTRAVISAELRDDEGGYDLMADGWLYVATGAQAETQRRIVTQPDAGYLGSMGALTLSRPFTAALASGVTVEATSPLPMTRHLGVQGYADAINQGLGLIWISARLSITGNGTYEQDLAAYPYVKMADQVRGIYDTTWSGPGYPTSLSPYDFEVRADGVDRSLVTEISYTTADTYELDVLVRADRLVYDGASWAFVTSDTPGLLGDDWQTAAPADWVYTFACWKAYQNLYKLTAMRNGVDPQDRATALADLMERRRQWARSALWTKTHSFPKPLQEPTRPLILAPSDPVWN